MLTDDRDIRSKQAQDRAEEILGRPAETFESPLTVLASPAWRGIEGDIWRASAGGRSIIVKCYHPDTAFYVNIEEAMTAAQQAAALGVGPAVLATWPQEGIFAMEDLGPDWRAGGLHDALDATSRARIIDRKKAFQAGARLPRDADIFRDIEELYRIAVDESVFTHRDIAVFVEILREAGDKLRASGCDSVPCHRDGNTANLMVGPDGDVKLIDYDLSANSDPFEDIGSYLVEAFESEADARTGFEEWMGQFDEGLFQRAVLYGMADDLRWGLIGSIMGARSPRKTLEFSKYAAWRFLRLEAHGKHSDVFDRIRVAK